MAISPDQKEAIMSARGVSAAPIAKCNTRRYTLTFADGKQATMLDMNSEPLDQITRSVTNMFQPGYLLSIALQ
jgi:hypothetical protein